MKLAIIITIIVGGLAAGWWLISQSNQPGTSTVQPTPNSVATTDNQAAGHYQPYSADVAQATTGTKILFFHAPWCPQCRQLDSSISSGTIPPEVTIFKVDYDSNQALRQKYGVTIQTTLVKIDDQGNKVASFVAYDEPTLQSIIDNLL